MNYVIRNCLFTARLTLDYAIQKLFRWAVKSILPPLHQFLSCRKRTSCTRVNHYGILYYLNQISKLHDDFLYIASGRFTIKIICAPYSYLW